jgi:maleylacetate reductase
MALLHKLCHTLGGSFDTPHVEMHAIRLPHMVGFNAAAVYDLLEPISAALGGATPGKALHRFASWLGAADQAQGSRTDRDGPRSAGHDR